MQARKETGLGELKPIQPPPPKKFFFKARMHARTHAIATCTVIMRMHAHAHGIGVCVFAASNNGFACVLI